MAVSLRRLGCLLLLALSPEAAWGQASPQPQTVVAPPPVAAEAAAPVAPPAPAPVAATPVAAAPAPVISQPMSLPAPAEIQARLAEPEVAVDGLALDHDELTSFYAARRYAACWSFGGAQNKAVFNEFVDALSHIVEENGLQISHYPIESLQKLAAATDAASALNLEFLITDSLLRLAHELHGDNNRLAHLYTGWTFQRGAVDVPALMVTAINANSLNAFIDGLTPQHREYRALEKTLALYRKIAAQGGWPTIDKGPLLRPNQTGRRIAELRARLGVENYVKNTAPPDDSTIFNDELRKALAIYQSRNGLEADGNLGARTLEELNMPVEARIDQILANMERWRHIPDDYPPQRFAAVNIPAMMIEIADKGQTVYRGPVIVGRIDRQTPFIDSTITHMIINPAWHVPASIARKDILPKLRKDPNYLEKLNIIIVDRENDPYGHGINWKKMSDADFDYKLRQMSGDQNSLGRLKFDFDNPFAVYLHGTPHQELFGKKMRSLSSGCVRLRDPTPIAEIFMEGTKGNWTADKIEDAIDTGKTNWVKLAEPMPIFILYWTVFMDESGELNFRPDIYDYDRALTEDVVPAAHMAKKPS